MRREQSAVNAAFRIREQLATVNASLQTRGLPALRGFGIHMRVVAAISSEDRLSIRSSDAVNVASASKACAKPPRTGYRSRRFRMTT